jgi:hypothetical protein
MGFKSGVKLATTEMGLMVSAEMRMTAPDSFKGVKKISSAVKEEWL